MTTLHHEVTGSGPPVVLLHAGFVDSRMWAPNVPALAERFTVVTYDLRGYGRSPGFDGPYSPVDDLRALLDHLGFERAALVGLSRGGRIAIDFTLEHPERVTALVAAASALSGHPLDVEVGDEVERRWERAEAEGDLATLAGIDLDIWAPLGDEAGLRQMALDNAHVNLADEQVIEIDPPAAVRLHEFGVPTLVVTGDEDVPAITAVGDRLEREIPGARRVVLPGDHFPNIRSVHAFNRLVAGFLAPSA